MSPATARRTCDAQITAVPEVRRFVRRLVTDAGEPDLASAAELVVSELVANVVLHVGGELTVAVTVTPGEVLVRVTDTSAVAPRVPGFSRSANTGRGLRLVQSMSEEYGVDVGVGTKTVWSRLTTRSLSRSEDELVTAYDEADWADVVHELPPAGPDATVDTGQMPSSLAPLDQAA